VKHFHHMLEARHFTVFTDHKPITFAFQQKRDRCSPRQFNHLDFIAQFTTDIRHIWTRQRCCLPRSLSRRIRHCATIPRRTGRIAGRRRRTGTLLASNTAVRLEKLLVPGTTVSIYCDMSAGMPRPYVPASLRLQVFRSIHDL
jgi:cleavage and polyadenylation specificity factor subunit 1